MKKVVKMLLAVAVGMVIGWDISCLAGVSKDVPVQANPEEQDQFKNVENQVNQAIGNDFPFVQGVGGVKLKIRKSECIVDGKDTKCAYLYSFHTLGSKKMGQFGLWLFPDGKIWGKAAKELKEFNVPGTDVLERDYTGYSGKKGSATEYHVRLGALFKKGQPICRGTVLAKSGYARGVIGYYYSNNCNPKNEIFLGIGFPAVEEFPKREFSSLKGNDNILFTNRLNR